jgi:hypothetical protein
MSFQIDTSFSVTEPTAAVGTDMFLVGGVMYYLALQADHLMVYTAPTKAGEEFVELFRTDLPVGFVPNEARIGDVLDGQFLISVYSNSGDYQAHFYEVRLFEFGGHTSELVATYVPSSASSTYRLKPARWSYGTKSTFLFVGRYGTYGDFAVFKGVDGVVQSGVASTILSGSGLATLSVTDRGLQWWDEDEQVWYRASYSNSGNVSNDDAYLSTIDLQGVGSLLYTLHTNSVYDNAYRRDGKFYATQHTQSSTRLQEVSKTTIVESIPIGSDFGVSPYVFGSSKRPMNYGKPSGYMYSASSGGYGVWYNRGEYTTSAHPTPNLATTGFVRYTVSLREDTPELLPYSLSPYSKHAVRDTALFGDYGLSMGTGLGTKPSTALTVGSAIGDVTQDFWLPPSSVALLEPKLYGRGDMRQHPYQPSAYWVSPDLLYTNSQSNVVDDQGWENTTGNNGRVASWVPEWLVNPTALQTGEVTEVSSRRGWLTLLYATATTFVYAYHNYNNANAYIFRYDTVAQSHTTLLTVPSVGTNNTDGYEYLQVGGQLNNKTANGVWICTTFSGDYNFWVEDGGDTLTPIATDDPVGRLSGKTGATPVAGGHGDFLFSFRQGWWTNCTYALDGIGTVLSVSLDKGQSWIEISYTPENASDSTGRITSAAMMGETLYYTQYKTATTVALYKYDVANIQPVEVTEVEPTMHLPMTEYNNSLSSLIGSYSHRTYYVFSAAGLTTFPIEDISSDTDGIASASYREAKAAYNSEYGAVLNVATTANPATGINFAIRADRIPDRSVLMEGWMGRSDRVDDWQWLPSPTPVIPPLQWDTTVAATSTYTYINPTQVRSGASTWDGAVSDERSTGKLYMEFHFEQYASEYNVVITPAPEALGGYQGHFKVGTTISNEVDASPFTGATTSMSGKYSTDTGLGCNAILYDIDTNTVTVWNADTVVYTGSFASTIGDLVAGKADPVTGFRAGVQSYYTTKWTYCNFGQDLDNYPWAYPHRAL